MNKYFTKGYSDTIQQLKVANPTLEDVKEVVTEQIPQEASRLWEGARQLPLVGWFLRHQRPTVFSTLLGPDKATAPQVLSDSPSKKNDHGVGENTVA